MYVEIYMKLVQDEKCVKIVPDDMYVEIYMKLVPDDQTEDQTENIPDSKHKMPTYHQFIRNEEQFLSSTMQRMDALLDKMNKLCREEDYGTDTFDSDLDYDDNGEVIFEFRGDHYGRPKAVIGHTRSFNSVTQKWEYKKCEKPDLREEKEMTVFWNPKSENWDTYYNPDYKTYMLINEGRDNCRDNIECFNSTGVIDLSEK